MNGKIDKIASFLLSQFPKGIQMFNCRGIDPVETIYDEDGVRILYSWYYEYIEVFGLTKAEYTELEKLLHEKGWKD